MKSGALLLGVALLAGCGPHCEEGQICAIAGTGELGFNGDELPALETRLALPTAVGVDAKNRVWFVDFSNMRVRVLTGDGTVSTLVGSGTHSYSEIGADRLESPLENPIDAAYGPTGLLHVVLQHEGRVIRVGEDGRIAYCVATGVLGDSGDGGDALDAEMGYGGGIAFAADGTLFVSDNTYSRVRRVDPDGRIETVLGTGTAGLGAPGYGPEVAIRNPERLAMDPDGNRLLVADTGNHRVLALDLDALTVTVVAGSGERGYDGDGGPATEARLDGPVGVQVTTDGTVLLADLGNDVLRAVAPNGTIETVAGVAGGEPSEAEEPLAFGMRGPAGLAWTAEGDLLIAARSGSRVLRWMGAADAL